MAERASADGQRSGDRGERAAALEQVPGYLIEALRAADSSVALGEWRQRASYSPTELAPRVGAPLKLSLSPCADDGALDSSLVPTYPYVTIGTWDSYGRDLAQALCEWHADAPARCVHTALPDQHAGASPQGDDAGLGLCNAGPDNVNVWRDRWWGRDGLAEYAGAAAPRGGWRSGGGDVMTVKELAVHPALPAPLHSLASLFRGFAAASSPQERLLLAIDFVVRDHGAGAKDRQLGVLAGESLGGGETSGVCGGLGDEAAELALTLLEQPLLDDTTAVEASLTLLMPLARLLPSPTRHKLVTHLERILSQHTTRSALVSPCVLRVAGSHGACSHVHRTYRSMACRTPACGPCRQRRA